MQTITGAGMVGISVIQPLEPNGIGWYEFTPPKQMEATGYLVRAFKIGQIAIYSAVEVVEYVDRSGFGPHYHVSMSKVIPGSRIERVSLDQAMMLINRFGKGFLEDNHVPNGKVRNFWRPVAERLIGEECPCVEEELAIQEGDFTWRWTNR